MPFKMFRIKKNTNNLTQIFINKYYKKEVIKRGTMNPKKDKNSSKEEDFDDEFELETEDEED